MKRIGRALATAAALAAGGALASPAPLSLTLEQAVQRALHSNRAIIASTLAVQGEDLTLETSRSEFDYKIVPTGSVGRIGSNTAGTQTGFNGSIGVQVARHFETGTTISLGPSFNRSGSDRNTTLGVSVEQPLLRGWDREINLGPVRRAEFSLASTRRALEQARINVALEAIAAYYAVLRERALVEFGAAQKARIDRHLRIAETKERAGIIGPMDLYRARIRIKDAEDAESQAQLAMTAALNRLRRTLELPLDTPLALAAPPEPPGAPDGDAEERALASRFDVAQARAELAEAERQEAVAAKLVSPDVTLRVAAGQATQIDPYLVQVVPATQRQWSVSLQGSTDIRRVAERNAWRQAQLRVQAARAALETRIEEVRRTLRDQRLALAEARSRIALREAQIAQAESRLALAQVKFAHDIASNLDVMEAESELQRAEASLAATRADFAVGLYQLHALAGGLLEAFR